MAQAAAAKRQVVRDTPFMWEGTDKKGAKVKGRSVAASEQALRAELRRQGVAATRIKKQSSSGVRGKVKPEDIAIFSRQLATMLAAGIPPGPAMGQRLATLRRWWWDGGCTADHAACLAELARRQN